MGERLTVNITIVGSILSRGNEVLLFSRSGNKIKHYVEFCHSQRIENWAVPLPTL